MNPWLQTINLKKSYGNRPIVNGVNLEIAEGEIFTFLGPSGAGKSTLFNCIAGLIYPDEGKVLVAGEDITRLPANERNIGMVFQDFSLFPSMTIQQNIAFPLEAKNKRGLLDIIGGAFISGDDDEINRKVKEVLSLVKLEKHAGKKPRQLSGGEQQRVALARALVFNPRLLCLDEPLGSLDKNLRYEMQIEIRSLQKKLGKTMLYVTHDQSEAFMISDRIAIVNHGQIEQIGKPEELYFKPANDFVALFLGECNTFAIKRQEKLTDAYRLTTIGGTEFVSLSPAHIDQHVIGIRPECLQVSQEPSSARALKGRVTGVTFNGGHNRLDIELATGAHVIALEPTAGNGHAYAINETSYIDYDLESILILPVRNNPPR